MQAVVYSTGTFVRAAWKCAGFDSMHISARGPFTL
jgi:hypothetical protein